MERLKDSRNPGSLLFFLLLLTLSPAANFNTPAIVYLRRRHPPMKTSSVHVVEASSMRFANPLTYGDYPEVMKSLEGNRLTKFTTEQSEMLKGSLDFLGVNYYTTNYAANNPALTVNKSYSTDSQVTLSTAKAGVPIGISTALSWLFIYPKGLYHLMHVRNKYKNPPVCITENGIADASNDSLSIQQVLKDSLRIRYHHSHLTYLLQAIKEGANAKGDYQWSFFYDFEWDAGYTVRFGMIYVDFKNNLKRYLKYSARWFKMFLLH